MVDLEFTVGTVIRLLRERKGLTQKDFSDVHEISLNRIEQGKTKNPKPETLKAIAERLGVTVEEIHDCVDRLNGALNAEPVDIKRRRLDKMLDEILVAGEPYSGAMTLNIESTHEKLAADRAKTTAKKEATAN